jgi:hypothetical protein
MLRAALPLLACLLLAQPAHAGRPCNPAPTSPAVFDKALTLAQRTQEALDKSGARVVMLARVGQDLSRYGLRYSHVGYGVKQADGRWLVVHELNACGTARSGLYREGLGNFFLDDMFAYEAKILTPTPAVQARLAAAIETGAAAYLHEPRYNMLSYAFSTSYQNSNQWVLEVFAAAMSDNPYSARHDAQRWLRANGFRPLTVEIGAMERLGARMFRANVAFDDHPMGRRMAGQIDTVTVDAVTRFVLFRDRGAKEQVVM